MMTCIISIELVIEIHDSILQKTGGAAGVDKEKLAGALSRIEQQVYYNGLDNLLEIASWYAVAIAKGHGFTDGNKRTALTSMLVFLSMQGVIVQHKTGLDDMMVDIVESQLSHELLVRRLAKYIENLLWL